jgi:hypothetical protein
MCAIMSLVRLREEAVDPTDEFELERGLNIASLRAGEGW